MDNFMEVMQNGEILKQNFKNLKSDNDIWADLWYTVDYSGEV